MKTNIARDLWCCVLFIFFFRGQKQQRQQLWLDLVVWERKHVRQDPNSCRCSLFMQPPSAFGHSEGNDCWRKTRFPQQSLDLRVNVGVRLGIGEAGKALGGAEAAGTKMIRFVPASSRLSSWKFPLPPQINHLQPWEETSPPLNVEEREKGSRPLFINCLFACVCVCVAFFSYLIKSSNFTSAATFLPFYCWGHQQGKTRVWDFSIFMKFRNCFKCSFTFIKNTS